MSDQESVDVVEATQVGEARRAAARVARAAGFGETDIGRVTLLATELGNNLARYGQRGRLLVQKLPAPTGTFVEVMAIDNGPGMTDVQLCLQDGYSTGGTPGTGLGAVRRQSTVFDLHSAPGRGTVVMARVTAERGTTNGLPFLWGAVSLPKPTELVCGDAWRISVRDRDLAVIVADGLGHGPLAAAAAQRAMKIFDELAFSEPRTIVERAHGALAGSRGAAIAIARITGASSVDYAGIGNISGSLVTHERSSGMVSQNGTVGVAIRKVQQLGYSWPQHGVLIMHSDGLTHRWSLDAYPGLLLRHPAVIAGVLSRDFVRGTDDATVVVVGGHRKESAYA